MRKKMMRNIGYNYIVVIIMTRFVAWCVGNMQQELELFWGEGRARILGNNYDGQFLTLSLDKDSGSGFRSRHEFLFGKIDMKLKLIPGNSAGTVTAYYLSSEGSAHDEIDFEFLGNLSGEPYTVHTNIFTQGKGNREEQFHLWFDPTSNFHTYSIIWNPQTIILSVDGIAIREFKNMESRGIGFPKKQAMRVYSSLWNADDWATRGGLVKTNWTQAPFTAIYTAFNAHQACISTSSSYSYSFFSCSSQYNPWLTYSLDAIGRATLTWVRTNYMIYNYCTDTQRFPQALPPECSFS